MREIMKLEDILQPSLVIDALQAESKTALLAEMAAIFASTRRNPLNQSEVYSAYAELEPLRPGLITGSSAAHQRLISGPSRAH